MYREKFFVVYSFSRYLKFPVVFVKRVSFRVSKLTNISDSFSDTTNRSYVFCIAVLHKV